MHQRKRHTALSALLSIAFVLASAVAALGQQATDAKSAPVTQAAPTSNIQTVNAQQGGAWSVGIDPAKNTVQLPNTTSDPLPVKVVGSNPARRPFQKRIIVSPTGTGNATGFLQIPAGKRLVIENISAIARSPEGLRMDVGFYSYMDSGEGPGLDSIAYLSFHRITLTDQGTFPGMSIATANHKVLVFADEQIGDQHFQVGVTARLNGMAPSGATSQAQVTFSGYLEDLPTAQ
jgi:hypothetical protein